MDCHVGVISIQFNIAYSGTYRECMRIFSYTLGLINKHYAKISIYFVSNSTRGFSSLYKQKDVNSNQIRAIQNRIIPAC